MVWENVPGAFSSNKGEDFRVVLEETAKVSDSNTVIPRPPKGKWTNAGCIMGDGWSIAWRVLDAQFWGVPQRRRRIALVADFGGNTAPEILFERKSVSGNFEEIGEEGQGTAGDIETGTGTAISFQERAGCDGGVKESLSSTTGQERSQLLTTNVCYGISAFESNAMKSGNPHSGIYEAETARTLDNNGGSPACNQGGIAVVAIENHPADSRVKLSKDNCVQCLSSRMGTGGGNVPMVMSKGLNAVCIGNGQVNQLKVSEKVGALNCMCDLQKVITRNIVRRLTPLECTRLQGFPDGWVDIGDWTDSKGKKHKDADSPKYKALGNSIAIPPWMYVLSRLNRFCTEHTMASLFDGIGGFSLIWETLNGRGSCIWASEIEEFPMAVTKLRFGNES